MEHSIDDVEMAQQEATAAGDTLEDSMRRLRIRLNAAEHASTEPAEIASQTADEDLSQEVRRLGRELFRANRAAERNQQLFEQALAEIARLSERLSEMPTLDAAMQAARFDAKADLCRDLLGAADSAAASVEAADELINRFASEAVEVGGLLYRFGAVRRLRESYDSAREAIEDWSNGQRLLADRLHSILASAGVRAITSLGRRFDPELHRAVGVEYDDSYEPGAIVAEELRGYTLEGRILRYAEVIVAKEGAPDAGYDG